MSNGQVLPRVYQLFIYNEVEKKVDKEEMETDCPDSILEVIEQRNN